MSIYVLDLREIDQSLSVSAGGKGANLGELLVIEGVRVPAGFCVTTEAYKRIINQNAALDGLLDELAGLPVTAHSAISTTCASIRGLIEALPIPREIVLAIDAQLTRLGTQGAYAVRSSATAEDLPHASFAGQQDTYLNIVGRDAILQHISRCWASLFTDRAVIYRMQNGFDHRKTYLAVVVQQLIVPQAAGILFTADPVSGNRKVSSIDASFGLGEALVAGLVNPDRYQVRDGQVTDKHISTKAQGIYALQEGGTALRAVAPGLQNRQVLTDEQIVQLDNLGRKIEAHFGSPQDIEWCLADGMFYIVQSRPITTLFPIPVVHDEEKHVYVSVGHQQMMTDAIKPLGISVWMLTGTRPIFKTSGGRLFVDVTTGLSSQAGRQQLLDVLGHSDPLIKDALTTLIERDFIPLAANDNSIPSPIKSHKGMSAQDILAEAGNDPSIVDDLIRNSETSLARLQQHIATKTGLEVLECILEDLQQQRTQRTSDMKSLGVIMAAIHAAAWINEQMYDWLGEKNVADTLSLSVPNNVTSEMGMALLDVADVVRPYPAIVEYLQQVSFGPASATEGKQPSGTIAGRHHDDDFLAGLCRLDGGQEVRDALEAFLRKYGMRCTGEIDITRPRWRERPVALAPILLANVKNLTPGESKRKFEQGRQEAQKKAQDLLSRLKLLPDGERKAAETKPMIDLLRNFIGYREYPKYDIVRRYFIYKQALLQEAERLVQARVLDDREDIYYLSIEELQEVLRTQQVNYSLIRQRKEAYKLYEKLMPPRVMTSEGEIITGQYKRADLPAGAIAGLAVSSGVIEGRARVILQVENADIAEGDILVTSFTDPSWTPLFVSIKGLVTEVGGLMTHGAVIAREYGLPAVVGVERATQLIKDGQRIRVNGTDGYVEIL